MVRMYFSKQWFISITLCLIFCITGYILLASPEQAKRIAKPATVPKLRAMVPSFDSHSITIKAQGTIQAANGPVVLSSRIAGRINHLNEKLIPGGFIEANEDLFRLDRQDAQLALEDAKARVSIATSNLKLERGQHSLATKQWNLSETFKQQTNKALALREPQLDIAERELQLANVEYEKAILWLNRATLSLPYSVEVLEVKGKTDEFVTPGTPLVSLARAGVRWLELRVPMRQLQKIKVKTPSQQGAAVRFTLHGKEYVAEVLAKHSTLSEKTRMGSILASIELPPYEARELLIGSYVDATVDAGQLHNVIQLPREALGAQNSVFVIDQDSKLVKRSVEVVWEQDLHVMARIDIAPHESIVTSPVYGIPEGALVVPITKSNAITVANLADSQ